LQATLVDRDGRPPLVARAEALLLLTDLDSVRVAGSAPHSEQTLAILKSWQARWSTEGVDWAAALINSRYEAINKLCGEIVIDSGQASTSWSDRIDRIVTHPVWGWFVFVGVMALMFWSIFTLAGPPMDFIDGQLASLADWVKGVMAPGDLRDLITDGVIAGVAAVLVFLPQILILFLFTGLLESTGYMARAAFIMDRIMTPVGLNGKSFIPMLSSHACAIPGIMATRTIEDPKERLLTILVAPLMSCSARLPVYLLMMTLLLPDDVGAMSKVGIMLLMYSLGWVGAYVFAWLFKRTLLKSAPPMMIMEMPEYHLPRFRDVIRQMFERAGMFLKQAGTIILGISIVLWFLAAYPKHGNPDATATQQIEQSYAGKAGRVLEPVLEPLGFDWRVGVGLISSFAAREVFVSSMGVIFGVEESDDGNTTPLRDTLAQAQWPDGRKLFTPLVCFTLMVYYVFAMQCMSTIAVVKRETNTWRWPLFQVAYMTGTAWLVCLFIYQGGRLLGF
jgi:ferrous iron transport protein B